MSAMVMGMERADVVDAVYRADGNEEKAVQILYRKQLQPYLERVHKTCSDQDLEWLKNNDIHMDVSRNLHTCRLFRENK